MQVTESGTMYSLGKYLLSNMETAGSTPTLQFWIVTYKELERKSFGSAVLCAHVLEYLSSKFWANLINTLAT